LATSDKTTIVIEKQPDGKMRVTSGSWDGEKVFLKDQVLEVRHAVPDARLHVARPALGFAATPPRPLGVIGLIERVPLALSRFCQRIREEARNRFEKPL
jgi:hypothetical protein